MVVKCRFIGLMEAVEASEGGEKVERKRCVVRRRVAWSGGVGKVGEGVVLVDDDIFVVIVIVFLFVAV